MVGYRITSVMVAQNARKGRRVYTGSGPREEVIPYVLFVAVLFLCSGDCGCVRDCRCLLGVPLLPLYMRGARLQERFLNRLRVGVLIGYNYISSCTRKIGSIPTPLEASCSLVRRTVLMESAGIPSARPTLSGRVHFGPPCGYPGVISPTMRKKALIFLLQFMMLLLTCLFDT